MAEPEFTLDLLGKIMLEMRADVREVNVRLGAVETRLGETLGAFRDELTVTSAMVVRFSSEHIAWGAMERQIKALTERIARVESRLPAAE